MKKNKELQNKTIRWSDKDEEMMEIEKMIVREKVKEDKKNRKLLKGRPCVVYLRSVPTLKADALFLNSQKLSCEEYAHEYGSVVSKIFTDNGASGSILKRPMFPEIIQYCKQNNIQAVIVCDVSKISMSYDAYMKVIDVFAKNNIKIHLTFNPDMY